jgi:hypothetical protein
MIELCVRKLDANSNTRELVQSLNGLSEMGIPVETFSNTTRDRLYLAVYSRSRSWASLDRQSSNNLPEIASIVLALNAFALPWRDLPSSIKAAVTVGIQSLYNVIKADKSSTAPLDPDASGRYLATLIHGLALTKCIAEDLQPKALSALLSVTARNLVHCNEQGAAMVIHGLGSIFNSDPTALKRHAKLLPAVFDAIEKLLDQKSLKLSQITIASLIGGLGKLKIERSDISSREYEIMTFLLSSGNHMDLQWNSKALAETLRGLSTLGVS